MRIRKKEIGQCNLVGSRIEKRRKEIGMKQKDLLTALQIEGIEMNASGLSKLEGQLRKISDYELLAFSKILSISLNDLLGVEEQ